MSAAATASLRLDPSKAFAAFDEWSRLMTIRGQSQERQLRRLMRFWISAAIKKLKDKGIDGDAARIEASLLKITRSAKQWQGKARGAKQERLKGTMAAALVLALNWQNARNERLKSGRSAFYGKVAKFINARKFSRGVHKAGFYPVLSALRGTADLGRVPRYRHLPGAYHEFIHDHAATLIAENFASSAKRPGNSSSPAGIAGLAPDILSDSEQEMAALLESWLAQDALKAWAKAAA